MDALKQQFTQQWLEAKQQIGNNTRLRVCVWFALFIIIGYPVLLIDDYREEIHTNIASELEKEARILRTANELQWHERAKKTEQIAAQIDRYFWQAESAGIAKATLLQTLNEWTTTLTVDNVQIRLEEPYAIEGQDAIYRISGQIDLTFDVAKSMSLINKIESNEKKIVIESMEIAQRTRPLHKIVIAAYFRVGG